MADMYIGNAWNITYMTLLRQFFSVNKGVCSALGNRGSVKGGPFTQITKPSKVCMYVCICYYRPFDEQISNTTCNFVSKCSMTDVYL